MLGMNTGSIWLIDSGKLSLNFAAYAPINGGPPILLSDGSSLTWQNRRGFSGGITATYWKFDSDPATLRVGPTATVPLGSNTSLHVSYQPFYLVGHGAPTWRTELIVRF